MLKCSNCGAPNPERSTVCYSCKSELASQQLHVATVMRDPAEAPSVEDAPVQIGVSFKVLTQKDKWFTQKFDPERLEEAINAYAQQGWRVVCGAVASFPGFLSANREEMIVILARDGEARMQYEYKVLTQKDKWFTQKFDPERLEGAINAYAQQGWRVRYCTTATFPGWGSNREEMVIILERGTQQV